MYTAADQRSGVAAVPGMMRNKATTMPHTSTTASA